MKELMSQPEGGLSERQAIVYDAIVRAANSGERCPTNLDLCCLLDAESIATPSAILKKLERFGLVRVTRYQHARTVEIVRSGLKTAEPRNRVRHWRHRARLTRSEMLDRVADALAEGLSIRAVADRLGFSEHQVSNVLADIRRHLGWQAV